jgi:hypothetical protein
MKRRLLTLTIAIIAAAALAFPAAGDGGGPNPGVDVLSGGVLAPNGNTRYVAVPDGSRTVVAQILVRNGAVLRSLSLNGLYGVPYVTNNGTVGGLSFNGRVLVLAAYAGPVPSRLGRTSRFAVVDIKRWRPGKLLRLRGDLSFDALSPKGRMLYLIEHTSLRDYIRYRVRAYDLAYDRLLRRTIVDRRAPDEPMTGTPVTRATGPGGTWVYTLYLRPNGTGFIHALDTRRAEAVCIELPWRDTSSWSYDVRMWVSRDGRLLHLRQLGVGGRRATVDTRSWTTKVSSLV